MTGAPSICVTRPEIEPGASTGVTTGAALLAGAGSGVVEVMVAVAVTEPLVAVTRTMSENVAVAPFASPGIPQSTLPPDPTGGTLHAPLLTVTLWNVVPLPMGTLTSTFVAVSGPLFCTPIV